MDMWRKCGEAASAAALYSVYSGLYSEAVVSSVASAVALAEVGQFKEAMQYVQRAAKAPYEAAREVFEKVKIMVQRLVELFVEAVARVLAWIDEHKAYLFLMAAVAAGVIALSIALNLWGLVELEKLAYAASLTPFVPAGVKEYSREEVFSILKNDPDPYEKFKEIARKANAGGVKLAEPWESLRVSITPKSSEEKLMKGVAYRELDESKEKALSYATLALEEAFGVYRTALREYAVKKAVEKREVGEGPFKRVMYMPDLRLLTQLAEKEGAAFENALRVLRKRLNEYAVKYGPGDLLNVEEGMARGLAEAEDKELSKFSGVNFGTKALAALMAYREYELGRRSAFGAAAWYWLEVSRSAWLFYYTPIAAHSEAEKAKVERPAAVEELVAEALRRLFLKPGADHHSDFIKLLRSGKLALELEEEKTGRKTESYVFRLYRVEEGGGLKELGIELWISKVVSGAAAVYHNFQPAGHAGSRSEVGAPLGVVNSIPAEPRLVYVEEEASNFFRHLHHLYNHRHAAVRRVAKSHVPPHNRARRSPHKKLLRPVISHQNHIPTRNPLKRRRCGERSTSHQMEDPRPKGKNRRRQAEQKQHNTTPPLLSLQLLLLDAHLHRGLSLSHITPTQ
jgi:hypothetical protein